MKMTERLAVAAIALAALAAGIANAATVITSTGQYPYSQTGYDGDVRDPATYPSDFPLPADRNGTLYITGLGTGISAGQYQYSEDVQLQGSGTFSYFTGIAQYSAFRNGQGIQVNIVGEFGKYDVSIGFYNPVREAFAVKYDQVFNEKLNPITNNTMKGDPWDTVTWAIEENSRFGASSSSDALGIGNTFTMTSNSLIVGPPISDPLVAVPEPSTWAMMIPGLGLIGSALCRRRRVVAQVSHAA